MPIEWPFPRGSAVLPTNLSTKQGPKRHLTRTRGRDRGARPTRLRQLGRRAESSSPGFHRLEGSASPPHGPPSISRSDDRVSRLRNLPAGLMFAHGGREYHSQGGLSVSLCSAIA